ncbi:MAG: lysophospholipase L1-like esterase [Flavobacteriales bacterium]|jgi:lysophospholipase L1-like esterase
MLNLLAPREPFSTFTLSLILGLSLLLCVSCQSPQNSTETSTDNSTSLEISTSLNITHRSDDQRIHYIGRFDKSDPHQHKFSYPGSAIQFKVYGKSLSIHLQQYNQLGLNAYVDLSIDGVHAKTLDANGTDWHHVFSSEQAQTHEISLSKNNEAWMGEIAFTGIHLDGKLLQQVKTEPKPKHFLFLGSSYETGFGNIGDYSLNERNPEDFSTSGMNHNYAYPALYTRALKAEHTCICFGGKGLIRAYDGVTDRQLPDLLFQNLALAESPTNMHEIMPNIIFLDIGGNDFLLGIPDKTPFIEKYIETITTLEKLYPKTPIVISYIQIEPPQAEINALKNQNTINFLNNLYSNSTIYFSYLKLVHKHFEEKPKNNIHLWHYKDTQNRRWGEAVHPSQIKHQVIADDLVDFVRSEIYSGAGFRN